MSEYEPHPDTIKSTLAYLLSGTDIGERVAVRTAEAPEHRATVECFIDAVHQHPKAVHLEVNFGHPDIRPTTLELHPSAQVDILTRPAKPTGKKS